MLRKLFYGKFHFQNFQFVKKYYSKLVINTMEVNSEEKDNAALRELPWVRLLFWTN